MIRRQFICVLVLLGALFTIQAEARTTTGSGCEKPVSVKISITNSGVYRIPVTSLHGVSGCDSINPEHLQLSNFGKPGPYSVLNVNQANSGDLIFLAHHLTGAQSYYNEFTEYNTYWLKTLQSPVEATEPSTRGQPNKNASNLRSSTRLEKDELRVRFPGRADSHQPEVWYWARINSIDPKAYEVALDLHKLRSGSTPVIKVGLRGWSKLSGRNYADVPDHLVEILINGHLVGNAQWQDQEEYIVEIRDISSDILNHETPNVLSLRVPKRKLEGEKHPLVDAVLLNWVEVEYDYQGELDVGQTYLRVPHENGAWFELSGVDDSPPLVMSERGYRVEPFESYLKGKQHRHKYATLKDAVAYVAVVGDAFLEPAAIEVDTPSDLRNTDQQADYLILSHARLIESIEPLADFHRDQGLNVRVIDIENVYDEFNGGVLAPAAIRDFISHAYHNWQAPAPRFVLLVGDASWDVRSEVGNDRNYADWTFKATENKGRFHKNGSSEYQEKLNAADRNLVPTWPVDTVEGYAASDNVFVAVDGDDYLPDLAIGRFPVSDPVDVTAIVNKTIAYHQQSEVGPWRSKVLWVTNEQVGFQRTSDRLENVLAPAGFAGTKVYPSKEEKDNIEHQAELQSAFNEGHLLVHFLGHGGRYVWRTGPPDVRKNHDLFTLEHLDQLVPNTRLPFVLSMTCYSAPFDHPTADSIGEKFLRLPDRGAIGILAASWRNSPGQAFSQAMLNELTRPGTMGEAVMRAKQSQTNRLMIETYNLLGDPATRLALPTHQIELKTRKSRKSMTVKLQVVDLAFDGEVMIDWQDSDGTLIESRQLRLRRGKAKLKIKRDPDTEIGSIIAYAWNSEQGIDAKGGIAFESQAKTRNNAEREKRLAARRRNTQ